MARPSAPLSRITSASTVGLPRESKNFARANGNNFSHIESSQCGAAAGHSVWDGDPRQGLLRRRFESFPEAHARPESPLRPAPKHFQGGGVPASLVRRCAPRGGAAAMRKFGKGKRPEKCRKMRCSARSDSNKQGHSAPCGAGHMPRLPKPLEGVVIIDSYRPRHLRFRALPRRSRAAHSMKLGNHCEFRLALSPSKTFCCKRGLFKKGKLCLLEGEGDESANTRCRILCSRKRCTGRAGSKPNQSVSGDLDSAPRRNHHHRHPGSTPGKAACRSSHECPCRFDCPVDACGHSSLTICNSKMRQCGRAPTAASCNRRQALLLQTSRRVPYSMTPMATSFIRRPWVPASFGQAP